MRTTSDSQYFTEVSREIMVYDIPWYWKDEQIYICLQQVGYIVELGVERSFKYKTVKTKIRFTEQRETKYINGGANIVVT